MPRCCTRWLLPHSKSELPYSFCEFLTVYQSIFPRVSLEAGGNAPFIVFDDANIDEAVAGMSVGMTVASCDLQLFQPPLFASSEAAVRHASVRTVSTYSLPCMRISLRALLRRSPLLRSETVWRRECKSSISRSCCRMVEVPFTARMGPLFTHAHWKKSLATSTMLSRRVHKCSSVERPSRTPTSSFRLSSPTYLQVPC